MGHSAHVTLENEFDSSNKMQTKNNNIWEQMNMQNKTTTTEYDCVWIIYGAVEIFKLM